MPLPMKSGTSPIGNPYEALALTNNPYPGDPIIRPLFLAEPTEPELEKAFFHARKWDVLVTFDDLIKRARPYWYKESRASKHRKIAETATEQATAGNTRDCAGYLTSSSQIGTQCLSAFQ